MSINIAIDGPSGAGKSSLAKGVAKELSFLYVDTGALYRTIGLHALNCGVDTKDQEAVKALLKDMTVSFSYIDGEQHVFLNGNDVTSKIRTNDISTAASDVSAIREVREFLLDLQKNIAKTNNVVMDGRDVGTVILPDAQVKIYLTASVNDRAMRRFLELRERKTPMDYEKVLEDIILRDNNDSTRKLSPLKKAQDAVVFDNTGYESEQTLKEALAIIKSKLEGQAY